MFCYPNEKTIGVGCCRGHVGSHPNSSRGQEKDRPERGETKTTPHSGGAEVAVLETLKATVGRFMIPLQKNNFATADRFL